MWTRSQKVIGCGLDDRKSIWVLSRQPEFSSLLSRDHLFAVVPIPIFTCLLPSSCAGCPSSIKPPRRGVSDKNSWSFTSAVVMRLRSVTRTQLCLYLCNQLPNTLLVQPEVSALVTPNPASGHKPELVPFTPPFSHRASLRPILKLFWRLLIDLQRGRFQRSVVLLRLEEKVCR
jgi:hypothetical protein